MNLLRINILEDELYIRVFLLFKVKFILILLLYMLRVWGSLLIFVFFLLMFLKNVFLYLIIVCNVLDF